MTCSPGNPPGTTDPVGAGDFVNVRARRRSARKAPDAAAQGPRVPVSVRDRSRPWFSTELEHGGGRDGIPRIPPAPGDPIVELYRILRSMKKKPTLRERIADFVISVRENYRQLRNTPRATARYRK